MGGDNHLLAPKLYLALRTTRLATCPVVALPDLLKMYNNIDIFQAVVFSNNFKSILGSA